MTSWTTTVRNLFSPLECLQIRARALQLPPQQATVGHGGNPIVDPNMRVSTVRWLDPIDDRFSHMHARITQAVLRANSENFGFEISGYFNWQFTHYALNERYDLHADNSFFSTEAFDRKLSVVIPLSQAEEFDGGVLTFELRDQPDPIGIGDMIVFPSFLRHQVQPVTRGERFSLVNWAVGPKWK